MGGRFPIGVGLALIVGSSELHRQPAGNPWLLFIGVALIVGAITRTPSPTGAGRQPQHRGHLERHPAGRHRRHTDGHVYPLVEIGQSGPNGLGPYASDSSSRWACWPRSLCTTSTSCASHRRPSPEVWRLLEREFVGPLSRHHWRHGVDRRIARELRGRQRPKELQVGPAISYAIGKAPPWWGAVGRAGVEGIRGRRRARDRLLVLMFVLFLTGLGVVSIAPLFAR